MTGLFMAGRVIFGLYFLYGAFNHLTKVSMMAGYAASKGVPLAPAAIVVSGILLLLGGLSILLGIYPHVGLILLIVFLIPVSFMMHNFWADTDPMQKMSNMVNFTKNMALLGAILMMFQISRPWPMSLMK
jgi:putative oxidoreductase